MNRVETLVGMSNKSLAQVFQSGACPQLEELLGYEFNGINTSVLTPILGIKKFIKAFDNHQQHGPYGYNLVVRQNPVFDKHIKRVKKDKAITQGYFQLRPSQPNDLYQHALVIDYNFTLNPALEPAKLLVDYIVNVDTTTNDLYLGKAFLSLARQSIFVSYFVLTRASKTSSTL